MSITGDGNFHLQGDMKNPDAIFSQGAQIDVVIDFNANSIIFRISDKSRRGLLSQPIPPDWSNIGFFCQVIQHGDSISCKSLTIDNVHLPRSSPKEIVSKSCSKVIISGKPWITTQDFGQVLVFKIEETATDINTHWRGTGYVENVGTKSRMPIWAIQYVNFVSHFCGISIVPYSLFSFNLV